MRERITKLLITISGNRVSFEDITHAMYSCEDAQQLLETYVVFRFNTLFYTQSQCTFFVEEYNKKVSEIIATSNKFSTFES